MFLCNRRVIGLHRGIDRLPQPGDIAVAYFCNDSGDLGYESKGGIPSLLHLTNANSVTTGASLVTGGAGTSGSFVRASNQYLHRPTTANLHEISPSGARDWSIGIRFRANTLPGSGVNHGLVGKRVAAGTDGWDIRLNFGAAAQAQMACHDGTAQRTVVSTWTPATGGSHYLIAYYQSASKTLGFAVDGETPVTTVLTGHPKTGNQGFVIGGLWATTSHTWDGLIDQVVIWHSAIGGAVMASEGNRVAFAAAPEVL